MPHTYIMKCSIQGCPGEYENKLIVHVVQRRGEMFLLEHVRQKSVRFAAIRC